MSNNKVRAVLNATESTIILELVFLAPISKKYICVLCQQLLRDPCVVTCCRSSYCQECISRLNASTGKCALDKCGKNYSIYKTGIEDLKKKMHQLKVYCPVRSQGCKWTGSISQLEKSHFKWTFDGKDVHFCQYQEIECPNQCGNSVPRSKMKDHLTSDCEKELRVCKHCSEEMSVIDISAHTQMCPSQPVECPNKCKTSGIPRCNILSHLDEECPLRTVSCNFRHVGCEGEYKSIDLEQHNVESHHKHLDLLSEKLRFVSNENHMLRNENATLRMEIKQLGVRVMTDDCETTSQYEAGYVAMDSVKVRPSLLPRSVSVSMPHPGLPPWQSANEGTARDVSITVGTESPNNRRKVQRGMENVPRNNEFLEVERSGNPTNEIPGNFVRSSTPPDSTSIGNLDSYDLYDFPLGDNFRRRSQTLENYKFDQNPAVLPIAAPRKTAGKSSLPPISAPEKPRHGDYDSLEKPGVAKQRRPSLPASSQQQVVDWSREEGEMINNHAHMARSYSIPVVTERVYDVPVKINHPPPLNNHLTSIYEDIDKLNGGDNNLTTDQRVNESFPRSNTYEDLDKYLRHEKTANAGNEKQSSIGYRIRSRDKIRVPSVVYDDADFPSERAQSGAIIDDGDLGPETRGIPRSRSHTMGSFQLLKDYKINPMLLDAVKPSPSTTQTSLPTNISQTRVDDLADVKPNLPPKNYSTPITVTASSNRPDPAKPPASSTASSNRPDPAKPPASSTAATTTTSTTASSNRPDPAKPPAISTAATTTSTTASNFRPGPAESPADFISATTTASTNNLPESPTSCKLPTRCFSPPSKIVSGSLPLPKPTPKPLISSPPVIRSRYTFQPKIGPGSPPSELNLSIRKELPRSTGPDMMAVVPKPGPPTPPRTSSIPTPPPPSNDNSSKLISFSPDSSDGARALRSLENGTNSNLLSPEGDCKLGSHSPKIGTKLNSSNSSIKMASNSYDIGTKIGNKIATNRGVRIASNSPEIGTKMATRSPNSGPTGAPEISTKSPGQRPKIGPKPALLPKPALRPKPTSRSTLPRNIGSSRPTVNIESSTFMSELNNKLLNRIH